MGERQNGRDVIDNLTQRQIRQAEKEGRALSSEDKARMKERARQSRLRGEDRRGQS